MVSFTLVTALLASTAALAAAAPDVELANLPLSVVKTGPNDYEVTFTATPAHTALQKRNGFMDCIPKDKQPRYDWRFYDDTWGYRDNFCQWIHNPSHPFDGARGTATVSLNITVPGVIRPKYEGHIWLAPKQPGGMYFSTYKTVTTTKDECIASMEKVRRACEFGGFTSPEANGPDLHGYGFPM